MGFLPRCARRTNVRALTAAVQVNSWTQYCTVNSQGMRHWCAEEPTSESRQTMHKMLQRLTPEGKYVACRGMARLTSLWNPCRDAPLSILSSAVSLHHFLPHLTTMRLQHCFVSNDVSSLVMRLQHHLIFHDSASASPFGNAASALLHVSNDSSS